MRLIIIPLFLAMACFHSGFTASWTPRAFAPGPDREITSLRVSGGVLYAAGGFGTFGPYSYQGVMRWDGQAWGPMSSGLDGRVQGIAIDGRGFIYASGNFTRPDGAYGLAVWDGTAWSFPAGSKDLAGWGPIATVGNAAYLVFESKPKEIYRCDGSALTALDAKANAFILALEGSGDELIVGGEFTSIGDMAANHVARYAAGWEQMAEGTPMTVRCLAVVEGSLLAGGGVGNATATDIPGLARWDGQKWTDFGSLPSEHGYINLIAGGAGRIYIGGYLFPADGGSLYNVASFAVWDGSEWKRAGNHVLNKDIQALAVLNGTVWVGGRFSHPLAPYLTRWDGNTWSPPYATGTQAPSGQIYAMGSRGGRMLAAGPFKAVSPDSISLLSEWTGNGWTERGSAFPQNAVPISIVALEPHGEDVYLSAALAGDSLHGLWRLSGGTWKLIGDNLGIETLRSTPDGLYAGGYFDHLGNVAAKHIARWDGTAWHAVGEGLDNAVTALEWDGSSLYAAQANTFSATGIPSQVSRFSGGKWSVLGTTAAAPLFNGYIRALAMNGGELWAAGPFEGLGLFNAKGVAVWNGTAWRGAGDGLSGVQALTVSPKGEVYATGKFSDPAGAVAHWNGKAWEALGTGLSVNDAYNPPMGKVLACQGEDLFVSGYFDYAGGNPSPGFARWTQVDESIRILPRARSAWRVKPDWRLFPDGRLILMDPSRTGIGFDAMGRMRINLRTGIEGGSW